MSTLDIPPRFEAYMGDVRLPVIRLGTPVPACPDDGIGYVDLPLNCPLGVGQLIRIVDRQEGRAFEARVRSRRAAAPADGYARHWLESAS
jgi:hypothetical protein